MPVLMPEGRQSFKDSAGAPLVGGKVWTYDAGTNNPRPTFPTSGDLTTNTNPVILDGRGEATIFWRGAYKVVLTDANDVVIWTVDNVISTDVDAAADQLREDLADTSSASNGDALVGVKQPFTGAVDRTQHEKNADDISVMDFGAVGDGVTDDSAAIQAAITWAGQAFDADWFSATIPTQPRVVTLGPAHSVLTKILVPRGVVVRGQNTTLVGSGYGALDNICFETAYFNAGVLTTNIGTAAESHRIQYSRIESVRFSNFRIAVNAYNFNEGCAVRDCSFYNVGQAVFADRCFYAQFTNLMNRGSAGGETDPCFYFTSFVNVELIDSIYCVDRVLAFQFNNGVNGLSLRNLSAEGGTNGIVFTGEVNPVNIDSCYFESLTGTAIDMTDSNAHRAVTIDNCWFQTCGTGIAGVQMLNGRIGPGNYFLTVTNPVTISDTESTIEVHVPASRVASGYPALPSGYTFGKAVKVVMPFHTYNSGTGISNVIQDYTGGLVRLPFSGEQGYVPSGVPFAVKSTSGTVTMTGFLDTKIVFDSYVMAAYALTISDNSGSFFFAGRVYGTTVIQDAVPGGKAVTASNNGGFLRLTITGLTHPSGVMGAEGIVRII